ncbi:MAG: ParB/RepB/Spo0J family partition protein [Desulfobacterales bacterium]|nr:ParB/RepB/Spo0J family partition protein [Desulfobacterales bacterium]
MATKPDNSFRQIPIEQITPDPNQPRKYFDAESLQELSESIRQKGVLQPIIVQDGENGKILLVAGERRYRAAKMAGLKKIPAMITDGNPAEIALIENLQREDLSPIEEAEALDRMIKERKYKHEQAAKIIGKGRSTVTEILKLTRLPEKIKEECRQNKGYSRRLLIEVAKQGSEEKMFDLFEKIKKNELNSSDVRKITRKNPGWREKPAIISSKAKTLNDSLTKLDVSKLSEDEHQKMIKELGQLKISIDKVLSV